MEAHSNWIDLPEVGIQQQQGETVPCKLHVGTDVVLLTVTRCCCFLRLQQPVVQTRGEDISAEYVALENKRNAFGELKKTLVSGNRSHRSECNQQHSGQS